MTRIQSDNFETVNWLLIEIQLRIINKTAYKGLIHQQLKNCDPISMLMRKKIPNGRTLTNRNPPVKSKTPEQERVLMETQFKKSPVQSRTQLKNQNYQLQRSNWMQENLISLHNWAPKSSSGTDIWKKRRPVRIQLCVKEKDLVFFSKTKPILNEIETRTIESTYLRRREGKLKDLRSKSSVPFFLNLN